MLLVATGRSCSCVLVDSRGPSRVCHVLCAVLVGDGVNRARRASRAARVLATCAKRMQMSDQLSEPYEAFLLCTTPKTGKAGQQGGRGAYLRRLPRLLEHGLVCHAVPSNGRVAAALRYRCCKPPFLPHLLTHRWGFSARCFAFRSFLSIFVP